MHSKLAILATLILLGFPLSSIASETSTPMAEEATIGQTYTRVYRRGSVSTVQVVAEVIDTKEQAKSYLRDLREFVELGLEQELGGVDDLTVVDLESFPAEGFELTARHQLSYVYLHLITFIDENVVFTVFAMDINEERADELATETARFVHEADSGEAPIELREEGTSTGGVFDRMPGKNDAVLEGYRSVEDMTGPVLPVN